MGHLRLHVNQCSKVWTNIFRMNLPSKFQLFPYFGIQVCSARNGCTLDGRTGVLTYEYLLRVTIVNFWSKIPQTPKIPNMSLKSGYFFLNTNGINGKYPTHVYPINAHLYVRTDRRMVGWTTFSTVFRLYHDDSRVMKGYVQISA